MTRNNKVIGFAAGILAAMFYGTNPLGALPLYSHGINSASVLFYRYGLATLMFALWMLLRRERFGLRRRELSRLALLGVMMALSSVTLFEAFHYMDAGLASTILFTYPIMVAVLMAVLYHEKASWITVSSIVLATTGIVMLNKGGDGHLSATGMTLVLISSLLYAFYIIDVKRWQMAYSPVKFTFWVVLTGFITIMAYSLVMHEPLQVLHGGLEWACGVQLALLPTVLSLLLMTIAISKIGSTPAAIMGALEPVTAVTIGVCLFGEAMTMRLAIGILFILGGVILVVTGDRLKSAIHLPHLLSHKITGR